MAEQAAVQEAGGTVTALFGGRRGEVVEAPPERLTKAELAARLRVGVRTIERWMSDPCYRRGGRQVPVRRPWAGGHVRFVLTEVEAWLTLPADRS